MPIVVGISLRTAGKIYYFAPQDERYLLGERVLVETARGQELGTVKQAPHEVPDAQIIAPLKPVLRRATAADITRNSLNREREEHAVTVCKRLVEKLKLPMRLIDAQYTLDGSNVLIHFLAESRVDFRELVRELARELHTRIELRQVGVRDEAKLLGGYGICGRHLCCSAFLNDFAPVAISMAKEQGLALNPQKISGSCGRLMCCLAFECDQYRNERADLPRLNTLVETAQGTGKVTKLNVMSRQVEVMFPDGQGPIWIAADELNRKPAMAHACCATTGESSGGCGGGCHHGHTAQHNPGLPSVEPAIPAVEQVATAEDAIAPAEPVAAQSAAPPRPRRRRKKAPAAGPAQAKPATPEAAAPRPRRRKPRPAKAPATAAPVPVPVGASAGASASGETAPSVPSARYRPRRRRRPSGPTNSSS